MYDIYYKSIWDKKKIYMGEIIINNLNYDDCYKKII